MSHENAALVINQFLEVFEGTGLESRVWDPSKIAIIFDHRVPAESSKTATNQKKLHPGQPSKQNIQSVAVHLIALYAVLELGWSHDRARSVIRKAVETSTYDWLEPPACRGDVTVAAVVKAQTPAEHAQLVEAWARSVWRAWKQWHERVRK